MTREEFQVQKLPVPSVVDRESILFDEEEYIKRVEEIVAFDSFDDMAIQLKELVDQPQLRMGVAFLASHRIDKALDRVFPNEPTPEQRSLLYHIITASSHFDAGSIIGLSESCYRLLIKDIQSTDLKIREEGLRILTDLLRSSREARDLYASREIENLLLLHLKEDSSPEEAIQAIQPLSILLEDNNIQTLQRLSHKEEILETLMNLVFSDHQRSSSSYTIHCLARLTIHSDTCKLLYERGIMKRILELWDSCENESLMLLSALAKEDSLRIKVFNALLEGTPSMLDQLVDRCNDPHDCLKVIELFGVVTLRNLEACTIAVNRSLDLACLDAMKKNRKDRSYLIQGSFLLRNLLSKCPECESRLIREGILSVIEDMKKKDNALQIAANQLKLCL
ncbi:hypothetical protein WA171_005061, partial [Blastocystis sp. BT1]